MDTYMFVTEISTVGAPHMWPHLCTGDNFYPGARNTENKWPLSWLPAVWPRAWLSDPWRR
jgi:hypothetical protein